MRGSLNIRGRMRPGTRPYAVVGEGLVGGRPLPVAGLQGYHPGKLFETETSIGAFLRIQKAILSE